jgi:hypothetical protein
MWEIGVAMIVKRYESHMNTVSAVAIIDYDSVKFKDDPSVAQQGYYYFYYYIITIITMLLLYY